MNEYDTDCELSSLNNGGAERRRIVSCEHLARNTRLWWHNSRLDLNRVLNIAWFDRLGLVRFS